MAFDHLGQQVSLAVYPRKEAVLPNGAWLLYQVSLLFFHRLLLEASKFHNFIFGFLVYLIFTLWHPSTKTAFESRMT
jgi:hypothetical protein